MTIDFSTLGTIRFSWIGHIHDTLEALLDGIMLAMGEFAAPTAEHLSDVNDQPWEKLDNNDAANLFHHNIAKLLFLCKSARPDVQTGSGSIPVRRVRRLTWTMMQRWSDHAMSVCYNRHGYPSLDMRSHTEGIQECAGHS
jgi:hypothetical protein